MSVDRPARFNITTLEADLEALHDRLAGVTVLSMDYADFIARIDRPQTLFYLDPPYFGNEDDYGRGLFARGEFKRMAAQLATIAGRFILSINDAAEIRETFAAFRIEEVSTSYTISANKRADGRRQELLISNFALEKS